MAKLCQSDAPDHVHQIMLLGKLGGQADENREDQGKRPIPFRDAFLSAEPDITEPACEAVDGREQVGGRIDGVEPPHDVLPDPVSDDLGPHVGGRQQYEKDSADETGEHIRRHKAVQPFLAASRNQKIVDHPEHVADKIDTDPFRAEGNHPVQGGGEVVVVRSFHKDPQDEVDKVIDQKTGEKRDQSVEGKAR